MANIKRQVQFMWESAVKSQWGRRMGLQVDRIPDTAYDNNYAQSAMSADQQSDIEIYRVDAENQLRIGDEAISPARATANFPLATNASIVTQAFFIAPRALKITAISCEFETADGVANTGIVTHDTGTQAAGTGATVMIGTFNLNATAATVQTATLPVPYPSAGTETVLPAAIVMAKGDRLSFKIASAVTSLAGLVISVAMQPGAKGGMAVYNMQANGDLANQSFFIANRPMTIQQIQVFWGTKSSSASSTLDVQKCTGTQAPASGTTTLTATVDVTAAANVVTTPALSATASVLTMAAGDRLSVVFAGAGKVALAGVVVMVWFTPTYKRKEVTFTLNKTANIVTQPFFIADRDYIIQDISETHAVLGTDGGAVTLAVTIDSGTTASGGGIVPQTDNSNAGFSLKATINTTQWATLAAPRLLVVPAGARLSVKVAGVTTAVAGATVTVSLIPS